MAMYTTIANLTQMGSPQDGGFMRTKSIRSLNKWLKHVTTGHLSHKFTPWALQLHSTWYSNVHLWPGSVKHIDYSIIQPTTSVGVGFPEKI